MRTIGCRITVINTGLFCELEIGFRGAGVDYQSWLKIDNKMARLAIIKTGHWGYLSNADEKKAGVVILPPAPERVNPDGSYSYVSIADLEGVPEDFLSRVGCGNYLNGGGTWRLTNEAVKWEMFQPCA